MMKLLLAEDTRDLNKVIATVLENEGYVVDCAYDGGQAFDLIRTNAYDGIILDIMMPVKSGLEVLEELRSLKMRTPVLLLTAKAEVDDRVSGLDAGADDYLTKPFAIKELTARLRAMLRRRTEYESESLSYEDFSLSGESFELKSENAVRLSVKEFVLLQAFVLRSSYALTAEHIVKEVWKDEEADADTVSLYVSYLNKKLGAIASKTRIAGNISEGFLLGIPD